MKTFNSAKEYFRYKGLDRCNLGDVFVNKPEDWTWFFDKIKSEVQNGMKVLDAGAGEGTNAELFDSSAVEYIGVDSGVGHQDWDYSKVIDGDITNLTQFGSEEFDLIMLVQVLEHVEEPSDVLLELSRVAKKSGKIYIAVPQSQSVHQVPNDFYRFTPYGLRYLLEKCGWEVECVVPQLYGDLLANIRRLQWAINSSTKTNELKIYEAVFLSFVDVTLRVIGRMVKKMDEKNPRIVNPIGYFVVARKAS